MNFKKQDEIMAIFSDIFTAAVPLTCSVSLLHRVQHKLEGKAWQCPVSSVENVFENWISHTLMMSVFGGFYNCEQLFSLN